MLKKDPLFPWRIDPNVYKNIYFYFVKEVNLQKLLAHKNLRGFITAGDQKCFNQALYAGVPLILIPFTFKQKFNAEIAKYMKVGIVVDHTKFVQEFPKAFNILMREDHYPTNILVENANKIKEAIEKFPNGQTKTFLEVVEKAIEDKEKEEPFPEMRNFEEDSLLYFGNKPFSVVLEEFVNSKEK